MTDRYNVIFLQSQTWRMKKIFQEALVFLSLE